MIPEEKKANEMFKKFGRFYTMPFARRDFSSSASGIVIAGWILAVIGLFHGFKWGIAFGLAIWIIMGLVARGCNPSEFLIDDDERAAHNEIISFIQQKKKEKREKRDRH